MGRARPLYIWGRDSGRYGVLFCGLEILDFVFYLSGLPSGPPGILDNES